MTEELAARIRELEAENAALRREADVAGGEVLRWRSAARQANAEILRLRALTGQGLLPSPVREVQPEHEDGQ
jgi:hypothetical protein